MIVRKSKAYIGRNKGVNRFGLNKDQEFGVPTILRRYFKLQMERWQKIQSLKIAINGTSGAFGSVDNSKVGDIPERVAITERLNSGSFCGGLV